MEELRQRASQYDARLVRTSLVIAQVVEEIFGLVEPFFAEHGLSRNGYAILLLVRNQPGLSPRQLAGHLNLTKSAMTGLLSTLRRAGSISRTTARKDKRSVEITITKAGEATLRTLIPRHLELHQCLLKGLDEEEIERLARLFALVRANVRRLRGRPAGAPDQR
jgi:DNA-binding MarR family transcriptional regulator